MPKKIIDPKTGFIRFTRTPEERLLKELIRVNEELKEENRKSRELLVELEKRVVMLEGVLTQKEGN